MKTKKIEVEALEYVKPDGSVCYAPLICEKRIAPILIVRVYFTDEDILTVSKMEEEYKKERPPRNPDEPVNGKLFLAGKKSDYGYFLLEYIASDKKQEE